MSIKGRHFFSQSLKSLLKNDSYEYEILNADLFVMSANSYCGKFKKRNVNRGLPIANFPRMLVVANA
jgi:hypothetical protein